MDGLPNYRKDSYITASGDKVYPVTWGALAEHIQLDAYVILIDKGFNFADYARASGVQERISQATRILNANQAAALLHESFPGETSSPSPKTRRL